MVPLKGLQRAVEGRESTLRSCPGIPGPKELQERLREGTAYPIRAVEEAGERGTQGMEGGQEGAQTVPRTRSLRQ